MSNHNDFKNQVDIAYEKNNKGGDTCTVSIRETDIAISVQDSSWNKEVYLVITNPQTSMEQRQLLRDHEGNIRVVDSTRLEWIRQERNQLEMALRNILGMGEGYSLDRLLSAAEDAAQPPVHRNDVHVLEPVTWAIDKVLAYGPRPGRYRTDKKEPVERRLVDDWIEARRAEGIHSILCLLDEEHLCLYGSLTKGLIEYYREAHFQVAHVPTPDYEALSLKDGAEIWRAFEHLQGPVLVHCSSGKGRSREAAQYIAGRILPDRRSD